MAEAFAGAGAGLLLAVAYDALKFAAASASTVVFLRKICSELEEELKLYEPFLKQVFDTMDSRAQLSVLKKAMGRRGRVQLSVMEEAVLDFKEKIEKGTKLLEDCKQISIWYPWLRFRFGKKILLLGKEIRQFMLDNRLLIVGNAQIHAKSEAFHKELLEEMKKVKESIVVDRTRYDNGKVSIVVPMDCTMDPTSSSSSSSGSSSSSSAATPPLPKYVVGLEDRVQELRDMLLPSNKAVAEKNSKMIAIVGGMGGIGKTTLAMAICKDQQVTDFFQDRMYFVTVSQKPDMVALCSTIWTKVTGDTNLPRFQNTEDAYIQLQCKLESHLRNSKCLLVLDDVWSKESMENLAFNIPGLWTLVTTRNAQMLKTTETLEPYMLDLLNPHNAHRLFCYWAFGHEEGIPSWINKTLVQEIIAECKGLPLALKVIGRWLSNKGRNEEAWRLTRDKLRHAESLAKEEQKLLFGCLKTSVDDLDEQLRDCFMDLAAFPEDSQTDVDRIMDIWMHVRGGMDSDEAFCVLTELAHRCLLDLKEEEKDLGGRKFLVFSQHDVLRDLSIQLGRHNDSQRVEEWRWLVMPQMQPSLPRKWPQLFNPSLAVATAAQIISIHLTADDIDDAAGRIPLIEKWWWRLIPLICGSGRKSTARDHNRPSLKLPNAEALVCDDHRKFSARPRPSFMIITPKLKVLTLISTSFILDFNNLDFPWENLKVLYINSCGSSLIQELPIPCDHLTALQKLILYNDNFLRELPQGIEKLQSLRELILFAAHQLESLPDTLSELSSLEKLDLSYCFQLKHLPHSIGKLQSLKDLNLRNAYELKSLPDSLSELSSLEKLHLSDCWRLKHLPHGIGQLQSLKELNLSDAIGLESLPDSLSELSSLEMLDLLNCRSLKHLPHGIEQLPSLKRLVKEDHLKSLPNYE